jgi:hypothetical protein
VAGSESGNEARTCDGAKVCHCEERTIASQLLEKLDEVVDPYS